MRPSPTRVAGAIAACLMVAPLLVAPAAAQPPAGLGRPAGPAREAAPVDLTGYWVAIVTEDWIERMSPDSPPSGTGGGFGRRTGGPAAEAAQTPSNPDDPCRVYGAGGSLRVPGRLHITWIDDDTLQLELDAGSQRRILHFDPSAPAPAEKTLQGYSVATWQTGASGGGFGVGFGGGFGGGAPAEPPAWGSLQVVTTNMTGGYLLTSRSNYSASAVLLEHFTHHVDFGQEYFTVTAVLEDGPASSTTSSTFKKEANGSKFKPAGCEIFR